MYTRIYRPGEYVRVGESEGTIVAMGLFTTRIRTGMGDELTIPSATVLTSVTRNYSRAAQGPGFIVDATVSIGYDTPWRQVHALLMEAARGTPGIETLPAPRVYQIELSDFYVVYRLVCQARSAEAQQRAETASALRAAILDAFNAHGVQIMSPHFFGDPATPKVVPRNQWYAAPAERPSTPDAGK
jgi:small-conductance mechanosensitive channel